MLRALDEGCVGVTWPEAVGLPEGREVLLRLQDAVDDLARAKGRIESTTVSADAGSA